MQMPTSMCIFPCAVTQHAHEVYMLLAFMMGVMFQVFCVVVTALFGALSVPSYRPHFLESPRLEKLWIRVPMSIIFMLGSLSTLVLFQSKGPRWPFTTLFAIGHQWYWEYEVLLPVSYGYDPDAEEEEEGDSDKVKSILHSLARTFTVDSYCLQSCNKPGEVRLTSVDAHLLAPTMVPFRLVMASCDVIHNYNIKALALSVDAVPGRLHGAMVLCGVTGIFSGWCSENCGVGHFSMPCAMEFIPFNWWMDYFMSYPMEGEGGKDGCC